METKETTRSRNFVAAVLQRCAVDNGFAAHMRRADNPDTEYYAYGVLCAFGVNLEHDGERRAFALIGSSLSRTGKETDGSLGLGEALLQCVESSDQGEARLRRMLACRGQAEACRMLRPLLSLIVSRGVSICHARLLDDLLSFSGEESRRRVCLRWAQEYYGTNSPEEAEKAAPEKTNEEKSA